MVSSEFFNSSWHSSTHAVLSEGDLMDSLLMDCVTFVMPVRQALPEEDSVQLSST